MLYIIGFCIWEKAETFSPILISRINSIFPFHSWSFPLPILAAVNMSLHHFGKPGNPQSPPRKKKKKIIFMFSFVLFLYGLIKKKKSWDMTHDRF